MEIWVTRLLSTPFHLLKIWKQIVQCFLNIFQTIAFVLSVSLPAYTYTLSPQETCHSVSSYAVTVCEEYGLFTSHLNCKYHPWELIDDMQMGILYNRKHWHSLSHSLHFVSDEKGNWRPTRPPR